MATSKFNTTYTTLHTRTATKGVKTRKHVYRYAKKSLVGGSAIVSASSAQVYKVHSINTSNVKTHFNNVKQLLQKLIPSVPTVTDGINYNAPIVLNNNDNPISLSIYAFIILYCMIEFNFKINIDNTNNIKLLNAENISIIRNEGNKQSQESIIDYMHHICVSGIGTHLISVDWIDKKNVYNINTFRLLYGFLQQFFTNLPSGHHLSEYINIIPVDIHTFWIASQAQAQAQVIKSINISNVPVPYYLAPLDNNQASYCSINVVIQMLWAIDMFRECIINLDNIVSIEEHCKKLQSINVRADLNNNDGYTDTTSYICMLALCKLFRDYHFKELITVHRINEYKSLKTAQTTLKNNAITILTNYKDDLNNSQYISKNIANQTQIETNETARCNFEIKYQNLYITHSDIPPEYIVGLQTGKVIPTDASKNKISLLYVLRRLICYDNYQFNSQEQQKSYNDHLMFTDDPLMIIQKVISHFKKCKQTTNLFNSFYRCDITNYIFDIQSAVNEEVAKTKKYNPAIHKILLITRFLTDANPQLQSSTTNDIITSLHINASYPLYYLKGIIYFQGYIDKNKSGHRVFIKYKYNNATKSSEMYCYISDSKIEYASEMTDQKKKDISTEVSTHWVIMLFTQDLT